MRRGARSGDTHAREALQDQLTIKPRANDPKPSCQNDAHRRLQLSPSDPRWQMQPPYGWVKLNPGDIVPAPCSGERCWYCAEIVHGYDAALYSNLLMCLAHPECKSTGE